MNVSIVLLQSPDNEFGKAVQLKLVGLQQATTTTRALSKDPAKQGPDIHQKHTQGHQEKTISRVGRRRPAADLASTTVAGFNAETPTIQATYLLGGHVEMDEDEDLPGSATFQSFGPFGGGEGPTHSQLRSSGPAVGAFESVLGTIALAALAKSTCTALFTADGAGDQRWCLLLVQEFLNLNGGKPPVQQ